MNEIVNIAGYRFVELDSLQSRRQVLMKQCQALELKGTILLSREGINLFLAGHRAAIDAFLDQLRADRLLADFQVKESISDEQPFSRLLVRIKKEIIAFGVESINPAKKTSPKIEPSQLKAWLDDDKPVTMLDVRNNYEIELGTFENAVAIDIEHFRQFPDAIDRLPSDRERPVVMFCTGGIRCEKAGPLMEQAGFQNVYQLKGGILQYFEECGGEHFEGECFVFDKRVALSTELDETETTVCFACQHVLTPDELLSECYEPGHACPYCFRTDGQAAQDLIRIREAAIAKAVDPLPGSVPYDNIRPVNVPARFDGLTLVDFLSAFHPHVGRKTWLEKIDKGLIVYKSTVMAAGDVVRAGQRIDHMIPGTVEPSVNQQIKILFEDDWVVAVNKPAPLPMHPSGRFNRNTLQFILNQVYRRPLRTVHRLDANTSGIVILCKQRDSAANLHSQFERRAVEKVYYVNVRGNPRQDRFTLTHPIVDQPDVAGVRRVDKSGKKCVTQCRVIKRLDGSTLLEARPISGRTNQIRIHLWQEGLPVLGDPTYRMDHQIIDRQTLAVDDPPMQLHASEITFHHPHHGRRMTLRTELPEWWL